MPQPTITVKDAAGATQTINTINTNGRTTAAESQPVALSDEDKAALDAIDAKLPPSVGRKAAAESISSVMSNEDKAALDAMSAKLPGALGRLAAAASMSQTLSNEDKAVLDAMNAKLAALTAPDSRSPVEPLGTPSVSRTLAAGAASASVTLTASCVRVSLVAVTADVAFRIGSGAQTAVATDHYLSVGERIDVRVPAGSSIGAIRAGTVDATLRISELT